MIFRRRHFLVLVLSLAWVAAPGLPAQSPLAPSGAAGKISGRVVRADNGAPVHKATVTLVTLDPRERGESQFVMSDAGGKFEFAEVPPGRYSVVVSKAGFVGRGSAGRRRGGDNFGFGGSGDPGGPITVSAGETQSGITLRLEPAGAITGTVTDEDGDAVAFVQVSAERVRFTPGGHKRLVIASNTTTDDQGNYRLHTLAPGKYYISARRNVPGGPVYLPTFYPSAAASELATPVEVRPGAEIRRTDITFRTGRTFTITGTVTDSATGRPPANYFVSYTNGSTFLGNSSAPLPDGSFRIRNVPPGRYILFAQDNSGMGAGRVAKPVEVLSADVQVALELGRMGKLRGHIRSEDGTDLSDMRLRVDLVSRDDPASSFGRAGGGGLEPADAGGNFEVLGVSEGEFYLVVGGLRRDLYVKEVRVDGTDIGEGTIRLAPGQVIENCEVRVASDSAELAGSVTGKDGQPAFGATVVLVPAQEKRRASGRQYRTATADTLGQFRVQGIIPGDYLVFGWDEFEDGMQYDPELLTRNAAQALKFTAELNGRHALELKVTTPR